MASTSLSLAPRTAEPLAFREATFVPWLLWLIDLIAAEAILFIAYATRELLLPWVPIRTLHPENYRGLFVAILLLPAANWLLGLYPGYGLGLVERLRRRVIGASVTFAGILIWDGFILKGGWSRSVELAAFAFAATLSPLVESLVVSHLIRRKRWGAPVVIVSSGQAGEAVYESLQSQPELGLFPIAVAGPCPKDFLYLSTLARTAILVAPSFQSPQIAELLYTLPFPHVVLMPELPGVPTLWVTPRDFGGTLGLELRRNLLLKHNYYFKRLMDYLIGLPLLVLSAPLIAILAGWIKIVSSGPAFYPQNRLGYQGRMVRVWKLRTMYPDAEELLAKHLAAHPEERTRWTSFFKLKHDPRVLPRIGAFLRRTSLDELPQLWNVVLNQMSLVGPRPFPLYHLENFSAEFRELRQSVPPGLTGFWQISERSEADLKRQEQLDTYYIRNWSLWLDFYILVRTVKVFFNPTGAY